VGLIQDFDSRVTMTRALTYCPTVGEIREHPILPRRARICPSRGLRHSEGGRPEIKRINTLRSDCLFCSGATPPILFYVMRDGRIEVLLDQHGIDASLEWLKDKDRTQIQTFYDLVRVQRNHNQLDPDHVARTFWNLTPAIANEAEACFVTTLHPEYHYNDIVELPTRAIAAVVRSLQFLEEWADNNELHIVPFVNGGKRVESGQSVGDFHSQLYAVKNLPPRYEAIQCRRLSRHGCPVCELINMKNLWVGSDPSSAVHLIADPAPKHDWSLLVVPTECDARLASVNAQAFADVFQRGVRAWRGLFGVEPAFNLIIGCGDAVGHVFAELIPRTETNILAGYEEVQEYVISVPPEVAANALSYRML
jgi:galactose-1-phosphate uridylyltransferase